MLGYIEGLKYWASLTSLRQTPLGYGVWVFNILPNSSSCYFVKDFCGLRYEGYWSVVFSCFVPPLSVLGISSLGSQNELGLFPALPFSERGCGEWVLILLESLMEFSCKTIRSWRLLFQEFLNCEGNFFNTYGAIKTICFIARALWWFVKWVHFI